MITWFIVFSICGLSSCLDAADYDQESNRNEIVLTLNPYQNNLKKYFQYEVPEDVVKKIFIMAIVQSPKTAYQLSYVSKDWNTYVNNEDMTKFLVASYFSSYFGQLNTYGRRKIFPTDDEKMKKALSIQYKKEHLKWRRSERLSRGCAFTSLPIIFGSMVGFLTFMGNNPIGLITIPISIFIGITSGATYYVYSAPKNNFDIPV